MKTAPPRLGRSVIGTVATRFFTLGAGATVLVLIARKLGPSGFGAYSLAVLVPTLAFNVLNLGVVQAASYQQARSGGRDSATTRSTFGLAISLGVAAFGVAGTVATLTPALDDVGGQTLAVALVALPFLCVWNSLQGDLLGRNELRVYNVTAMADRALLLVLVSLALVLGGRRPVAAVAGMTMASVGTTFLLVVLAARRGAAKPRFGMTAWRPMLSFGTRAHVANLATALSYRVDLFLVGAIAGVAEAGKYAAAVALAEVLWIVSQSSNSVLFPRIVAARDEEGAQRLTATFARNVLWITVVLAAGLAALADVALEVVYDRAYLAATGPLRVLLIGVVALSVSRLLATHITGRGRPGLNAIGSVVAAAVNVVLNLILIPRHGMLGAATASAASYTLAAVITIGMFHKLFGAPVWALLVPHAGDIRLILRAVRG